MGLAPPQYRWNEYSCCVFLLEGCRSALLFKKKFDWFTNKISPEPPTHDLFSQWFSVPHKHVFNYFNRFLMKENWRSRLPADRRTDWVRSRWRGSRRIYRSRRTWYRATNRRTNDSTTRWKTCRNRPSRLRRGCSTKTRNSSLKSQTSGKETRNLSLTSQTSGEEWRKTRNSSLKSQVRNVGKPETRHWNLK